MSAAGRSTLLAVLEMWNGATTEGLPELLAPGYRGHMLGVVDGDRDAAAYPGAIARYRAAVPDVVFGVIDQFDAGERLVTRLEARRAATADGPASISHGMNIARFGADARLAEEWAIWSPWVNAGEGAPRPRE